MAAIWLARTVGGGDQVDDCVGPVGGSCRCRRRPRRRGFRRGCARCGPGRAGRRASCGWFFRIGSFGEFDIVGELGVELDLLPVATAVDGADWVEAAEGAVLGPGAVVIAAGVGGEASGADVVDDQVDGALESLGVLLVPFQRVVPELAALGDVPVGGVDGRPVGQVVEPTRGVGNRWGVGGSVRRRRRPWPGRLLRGTRCRSCSRSRSVGRQVLSGRCGR